MDLGPETIPFQEIEILFSLCQASRLAWEWLFLFQTHHVHSFVLLLSVCVSGPRTFNSQYFRFHMLEFFCYSTSGMHTDLVPYVSWKEGQEERPTCNGAWHTRGEWIFCLLSMWRRARFLAELDCIVFSLISPVPRSKDKSILVLVVDMRMISELLLGAEVNPWHWEPGHGVLFYHGLDCYSFPSLPHWTFLSMNLLKTKKAQIWN